MKGILGRLSRVGDASQYRALRAGKGKEKGKGEEEEEMGGGGDGRRRRRRVKEGHVPVCVGEEMARFAVPAELLGRPEFVELLRRAAAEYGYEHPGVLRIPCPVPIFLSVLRSLSNNNNNNSSSSSRSSSTATATPAPTDDDTPELFWCLRSPSLSPPSR